jgi:hypothetical protein
MLYYYYYYEICYTNALLLLLPPLKYRLFRGAVVSPDLEVSSPQLRCDALGASKLTTQMLHYYFYVYYYYYYYHITIKLVIVLSKDARRLFRGAVVSPNLEVSSPLFFFITLEPRVE